MTQPVYFEELDQPLGKRQTSLLDLDRYDKILVQSSGGKDSGAMVLFLLKMGIPKERIELWHQSVDGGPGARPFMDWPVTEAYVKAFAQALGIRVEFMWREGGIHGELLRENNRSKGVGYARAGSRVTLPTVAGSLSTRRRWPAKSASLLTRWCSGVVKIDVFRRVLCNELEFKHGKYLVLSGERREDALLTQMLDAYRYSYREISIRLKRTEGALKRRMGDLGLKQRPLRADNHNPWTDEETEILMDLYYKGYVAEVMAEKIPRSALAINGKIERMVKDGELNLKRVDPLKGETKLHLAEAGVSFKEVLPEDVWPDIRRFLGELSHYAGVAKQQNSSLNVGAFLNIYAQVYGSENRGVGDAR